MLQCVKCGLHATVTDPSTEEWGKAFHAPSQPYRWKDEDRLVIHKERPADLCVQKKPPTFKKCECYECGVVEPGRYERVWSDVIGQKPKVTAEARKELLHVAVLADQSSDLCSTLFPVFIDRYQQDTGNEPCYASRWVANRIEKLRSMGVHCSSAVVATLLRHVAKG